MVAETELPPDAGQRFGADQRGVPTGELADLLVRKFIHQQPRDDQAQYPVAEEFQTLQVALAATFAFRGALVGQCFLQQLRLPEFIPQFRNRAGNGPFDDFHLNRLIENPLTIL